LAAPLSLWRAAQEGPRKNYIKIFRDVSGSCTETKCGRLQIRARRAPKGSIPPPPDHPFFWRSSDGLLRRAKAHRFAAHMPKLKRSAWVIQSSLNVLPAPLPLTVGPQPRALSFFERSVRRPFWCGLICAHGAANGDDTGLLRFLWGDAVTGGKTVTDYGRPCSHLGSCPLGG
jgi:hypothetical protein